MMLRGHSHTTVLWLCIQELLLALLGGLYGMLGIELRLTVGKANTLPPTIALVPRAAQLGTWFGGTGCGGTEPAILT